MAQGSVERIGYGEKLKHSESHKTVSFPSLIQLSVLRVTQLLIANVLYRFLQINVLRTFHIYPLLVVCLVQLIAKISLIQL